MKNLGAGRRWRLTVLAVALVLGTLGTSLAMTPVDGHGLVRPARQQGGQTVVVTVPDFIISPEQVQKDWTAGCLRDPAGAERLRQLHLRSVRPLALALDTPLQHSLAPEWVECR